MAVVTAVALLTAACGGTKAVEGDGGQDDDSGVVDASNDKAWDEDAIEAAQARAEALLGTDEASLDDDVRVGRRGDVTMMLTEDYVHGRLTVELDPDDGGVQRVVGVTVELPGGPQTFNR